MTSRARYNFPFEKVILEYWKRVFWKGGSTDDWRGLFCAGSEI